MLLLRYNQFQNPDASDLERVLADIRERLRREAKERGGDLGRR